MTILAASRRIAAALLLMLATMPATPAAPIAESRTDALFRRLAASPPRLRMVLAAMPKGGDLHNHLSGAIYAEDALAWAAAQGLCIATDTNRIVAPPCDAPNRMPARGLEQDYARYAKVIETVSTRDFEKGVGDPAQTGYDRFFASFGGFNAAVRDNMGKALAAAREEAALDHVSYLELQDLPRAVQSLQAAMRNGDGTDFAVMDAMLAPLLPAAVSTARAGLDRQQAEANALQGCGTQAPAPACAITVRYLVAAGRTQPPAQVFAALEFGFALAEADPRVVGVNIVAPEHDPVAIRDYGLHMRMFAWLKARHPGVKLSLHAGELTGGLVPPRDLRFHIRDAVEVAGARRIGHGVDISYEDNAPALLARMAHDRIAVEINLTSNAVILGVKGRDHPLAAYRAAGVPFVLSTDDQGVSRSSMTEEYMRAVLEQGLSYHDLKQATRNSLEYAFLPGASLWRSGVGGAMAAPCAAARASAACAQFLAASPKAKLQWQLEQDLARFERAHP